MTVRIQKWGNSLAVRIPRQIASEVKIVEGSEVELIDVDGRIILEPRKPEPSLEELLAKITDDNLHTETDFGAREGRENW